MGVIIFFFLFHPSVKSAKCIPSCKKQYLWVTKCDLRIIHNSLLLDLGLTQVLILGVTVEPHPVIAVDQTTAKGKHENDNIHQSLAIIYT